MNEKHVQITAQLYDIRAKMRRLLGEEYPARMAGIGKIISAVAAAGGTSELQAAIKICNDPELLALDRIAVLAAAVELVEPTP